MRNARFWTGLVFFGGLPMGLVMGMVREPVPQTSHLEGYVTYHGRPLTQGVIYLQSQDREHADDIFASIEANGHFAGSTRWSHDLVGRARFQIHLLPDPRGASADPILACLVGGGVMARVTYTNLPGRETPGVRTVVSGDRAGATPSIQLPRPKMGPALPASGSEQLEVWLGAEPTRLDIDLKD